MEKFKLSVISSESGKIYVEALRTVKVGKYQVLNQRGFIQVETVADAKALVKEYAEGTLDISMSPKADRNNLHTCRIIDDSTTEETDESLVPEEETIVTSK